MPKTGDNLKI